MKELILDITLLDSIILTANLLLILFAGKILKVFDNGADNAKKTIVFRSLNIFILATYIWNHVSNISDGSTGMLALETALIVYGAFAAMHVLEYVIIKKYGKTSKKEGEPTYENNYSSKLITLVTNTLIILVSIVAIIRLFGFNSLLETGGVIGFIGVFFALTHSSWSPDIFSGLIILNSDSIKDGDVIEYKPGNNPIIGVVWKTKLFHTEILNVVDGHKIMIWNSKLKSYDIQNLSSKASSKGLRERIELNIGFEHDPKIVRTFLENTFEKVKGDPTIKISKETDTEVNVGDVGDYSVTWNIYYYIKNKDDIKYLVKTRQQILEWFLKESFESDISLATPTIIDITRKDQGE